MGVHRTEEEGTTVGLPYDPPPPLVLPLLLLAMVFLDNTSKIHMPKKGLPGKECILGDIIPCFSRPFYNRCRYKCIDEIEILCYCLLKIESHIQIYRIRDGGLCV